MSVKGGGRLKHSLARKLPNRFVCMWEGQNGQKKILHVSTASKMGNWRRVTERVRFVSNRACNPRSISAAPSGRDEDRLGTAGGAGVPGWSWPNFPLESPSVSGCLKVFGIRIRKRKGVPVQLVAAVCCSAAGSVAVRIRSVETESQEAKAPVDQQTRLSSNGNKTIPDSFRLAGAEGGYRYLPPVSLRNICRRRKHVRATNLSQD